MEVSYHSSWAILQSFYLREIVTLSFITKKIKFMLFFDRFYDIFF